MPAFLLHKRLEELTRIYNQKTAVFFKRNNNYESLSFSQFLKTAEKIGYFLIQEKVGRPENIALFLENQPLWGCIYFGIIFSGAVAVPLDAQLTSEELGNIFDDAQIRFVFTSKTLAQKIPSSHRKVKIILVEEIEEGFIKDINIPADFLWPYVEVDDVCSLVYTSGTTQQPKAVELTQRNFSTNIESILKLGLLTPEDNLLCILPLHHTYPFMVNLLVPLFLGAKVTYLNSLKSEDILACMRETGITILVGVPQLFSLLLAGIKEKIKKLPVLRRIFLKIICHLNLTKFFLRKLHNNFGANLRFFASGGAKLDPQVAKGLFKLGFTIIEGYGLTETSPVVSFNLPNKFKIGSVGQPIPGVEIKIENPDKKGIGEIIIRGDNVMKGYYKRPDLTQEVIKDNWFYSGDLGYIDKEGFLYITGRKKEVIVLSSGKNIYPEELETFYKESPYIKELCVLDVGRLHSIIVPDMDYFKRVKITDIKGTLRWELEALSKKLPSFKRLMGFTILTEKLPRTRLGKIQRWEVKKIYESRINADIHRYNTDTRGLFSSKLGFPEKVQAFLSQELKMAVKLTDHLELDLGIDSLKRVELGLSLEKFLGRELPDYFLSEVFTVGELISKLQVLLKEKTTPSDLKQKEYTWHDLLLQPPAQEIIKKIEISPSLINKIVTFLVAKIVYSLLFIFCFFRIKGRKNLPQEGAYILCSNHSSYLDGFIILASLPFGLAKKIFFLGHTQIFELPIFKWTVRTARIISVDPSIHLIDAMQAAAFVLRNSKLISIFPEGGRSYDEEIKEFKNGIGILIKELDLPCIPIYIKGAHYAWPRTRVFPRPYPIEIIFGRSYQKEELKSIGRRYLELADDYTLITQGLRQTVLELGDKI